MTNSFSKSNLRAGYNPLFDHNFTVKTQMGLQGAGIVSCNIDGQEITISDKAEVIDYRNSNIYSNSAGDIYANTGLVTDITTLTQQSARVTEQKYYEYSLSELVDQNLGEGAWNDELQIYGVGFDASNFESGYVNKNAQGQFVEANIQFDSFKVPIKNWAMRINFNMFEINEAAANKKPFSIVEQKNKSLLKAYQLGIQRVQAQGADSDSAITGFLNATGVTNNTTVIAKSFTSMTDAEFISAISKLVSTFWTNTEETANPNTFVIATADYQGLIAPITVGGTGTSETRLNFLERTLKQASVNPNFRVIPWAYSSKARNNLNTNRYVLYNKSPEVLEFGHPVPYTSLTQNTTGQNTISFHSEAFAQHTGVYIRRIKEIVYFSIYSNYLIIKNMSKIFIQNISQNPITFKNGEGFDKESNVTKDIEATLGMNLILEVEENVYNALLQALPEKNIKRVSSPNIDSVNKARELNIDDREANLIRKEQELANKQKELVEREDNILKLEIELESKIESSEKKK